MTPSRNDLINVQQTFNKSVTLADGSSHPVEGHGVAPIHFDDKGIKYKGFSLVSFLKHQLILEIALIDEGWSIT